MKNIVFILLCITITSFVSGQGVFSSWDSNKDNRIVLSEFPGQQKNIQYFQLIDSNKDRVISRQEFKTFFGNFSSAPALKIVATNGQGQGRLPVQIRQLKQENFVLKKNLNLKTSGYSELTARIHRLQKENKQLKNVIQVKTSGYGKFGGRIRQLEQQNAAMKQQLNNITARYRKLQAQYQAQVDKFTKLNQRYISERGHRQSCETRCRQLEQQLAQQGGNSSPRPPQPRPMPRPKKIDRTRILSSGMLKPNRSPAQNMLMAEEAGRLVALRELASKIRGSWIASCSQNIDAVSQIVVIGKLDPTRLVGVRQLNSDYDFIKGMVSVPVEITRANIIESIHRANPKMTPDDYQELRFMFPEKMVAKGYGAWTPRAQKRLLALYGAQLDARRKLVERLRGVLVKSSTRMRDFVVEKDEIMVSIESSLLIGVKVVKEEIIGNEVARVEIEISRPMFIYSMRKGMESHGVKMSPAEYQNLRNMLNEKKYTFIGKAAIDS